MSIENMENMENNVQGNKAEEEMIKKLFGTENLIVLISLRTKQPFVVCDNDTLDDQILVFDKPEYAHTALTRHREEGNPVEVAVIAQKDRMNFYASLCTLGVNCVVFNAYSEVEERFQLSDFIGAPKTMPNGQPWIDNPSLYLTAAYFMQAIARNKTKEETAELTELREEIVGHYANSTFIILFNEKGQLPALRFENGDSYHPIFTDMFEAVKFKADQKVSMGAIPSVKIPTILAQEVKGVVINPNTVCLQLPIIRKPLDPSKVPGMPTEENK